MSVKTDIDESRRSNPGARPASPATGLPAVIGLTFLITFTGYAYTYYCGYIWDDNRHALVDTSLWSLYGLWRIWFTHATQQYYPLVYTSFWLEAHLWGLNPAASHLVNVFIHAVNAILVYRVLSYLKVPGAMLAGLIFAIHPVNVESVAWISERKNVLSGLLYLLSLLSFIKLDESQGKKRHLFYLLSFFFFLLAMLSKTVACTLPVVLIIVRWMRGGRISSKFISSLVPFFATGLALGLLTVWWERNFVGASGGVWDLSLIGRAMLAGRVIWFYLYKLAWPAELTFIYTRWHIDPSVFWQYLFLAAVVIAGVILYFLSSRVGRKPAAASAFFIVTLFPALGFFNIYPFKFSFVADHFQYLASIGPIGLVSGIASVTFKKIESRPAAYIKYFTAIALLTALWFLTVRQTFIYKDEITLWKDTIRKNPGAWIAYNNLGVIYLDRRELDTAMIYLSRAYELDPSDAGSNHNLGLAYYNRGLILKRQDKNFDTRGINGLAIKYYRQAIKINPAYAEAHVNLGLALVQNGEIEEAVSHYREALQIQPDYTVAYVDLGLALLLQERFDEAVRNFRIALDIEPGMAAAQQGIEYAQMLRTERLRARGKADE